MKSALPDIDSGFEGLHCCSRSNWSLLFVIVKVRVTFCRVVWCVQGGFQEVQVTRNRSTLLSLGQSCGNPAEPSRLSHVYDIFTLLSIIRAESVLLVVSFICFILPWLQAGYWEIWYELKYQFPEASRRRKATIQCLHWNISGFPPTYVRVNNIAMLLSSPAPSFGVLSIFGTLVHPSMALGMAQSSAFAPEFRYQKQYWQRGQLSSHINLLAKPHLSQTTHAREHRKIIGSQGVRSPFSILGHESCMEEQRAEYVESTCCSLSTTAHWAQAAWAPTKGEDQGNKKWWLTHRFRGITNDSLLRTILSTDLVHMGNLWRSTSEWYPYHEQGECCYTHFIDWARKHRRCDSRNVPDCPGQYAPADEVSYPGGPTRRNWHCI